MAPLTFLMRQKAMMRKPTTASQKRHRAIGERHDRRHGRALRRRARAERDERRRAEPDEAHAFAALQPDERQEEPDPRRRRYPDGLGDELGELGAQADEGDEEEDESLEEDGGERGAVGERARAMEPDDRVGEVGIGAHPGGRARWAGWRRCP
ncbi:hypothetical protein EE612_028721 [Oryza sativa]|nr:hypothetical protein EE612_028721 [Oryza sativa]